MRTVIKVMPTLFRCFILMFFCLQAKISLFRYLNKSDKTLISFFFVKLQMHTYDLVGMDAHHDFLFVLVLQTGFEMAKSGFDILIIGTALPQIFIWAVVGETRAAAP